MIIASCRRNFTSACFMSRRLQLRDYDTGRATEAPAPLDLAALQAAAQNQHVCIVIHGFNNTMAAVLEAYDELQSEMKRNGVCGTRGYGLVVGFAWPGWIKAPGFFPARRSAHLAAPFLQQLVNDLRRVALSVDIQTHSLGARVALQALRKPRVTFVDNLILSAPAVDIDRLEPGRPFHSSLDSCNRCFVYHSRTDSVLKLAYRTGDIADGWKKALGLNGPRSREITLRDCPNVYVVDCTAFVPGHSDYRRAARYHAHWTRVLTGAPIARYDTL